MRAARLFEPGHDGVPLARLETLDLVHDVSWKSQQEPFLGIEWEPDRRRIGLVEQAVQRQGAATIRVEGWRATFGVQEDDRRDTARARKSPRIVARAEVAVGVEEVAFVVDQELERLKAGERNSVVRRDLRHDGLELCSHELRSFWRDVGPVRASRRAVDVVGSVVDPYRRGSRRRLLRLGAETCSGLSIEESSTYEEAQRREEVGVRHRRQNAIVESGIVVKRFSDYASGRLDEEVVLMNLRTNKIFSLNRTGARAWELVQTGHDWPAIRRTLLREFDVTPEVLDGELKTLAASLAAEGFIHGDDPSSDAPDRAQTNQRRTRPRSAPQIGSAKTAWLMMRMAAWSLALPVLKRLLPLPKLVRLMSRESSVQRSNENERTIARSARRIYRLRQHGSCLERSLTAYRYLSGASANPLLVVGVGRDDRDVIGHAWVLIDGQPLYESSAALESFVPVVAFASDGSATATVDSFPRP